jgi:hypothetical protein
MLDSIAKKRLLDAVNVTPVTVADVVSVMAAIDRVLPPSDGLKWFNRLYMMVTEEIDRDCALARWRSPEWLVHLDVEFAKLYFDAIRSWTTSSGGTPRAWAGFFERRFTPGIARVQYGLAGINAHINRDLACAVLRACALTGCAPRWGSDEHADYLRVNAILDAVEVRAMQRMATGIIRRVSGVVQPLDRITAMAVIGRMRDVAWLNAIVMHRRRRSHVEAMDVLAGAFARALLLPTERLGTLDDEDEAPQSVAA